MAQEGRLKKVLGKGDILALAFGAMIGWGWVVLVGQWVNAAGSMGAILAFAVGGLAVVLIGLAYSELASAMPIAGGEHIYTYRALGVAASFVCTWALILGYVSVVTFEAVAFPTVIEYAIPGYKMGLMYNVAGWDVHFTWVLVGVLGSILMTWINLRGIQTAALFQTVVTWLILAGGVALVIAGLVWGDTAKLEPKFIGGFAGFFAVIIMTPFMFVGFDVIPQTAEETDLPHKKIGSILMLSVVMAVAWYILIILASSLAMTPQEMEGSKVVTADALARLVGSSWGGMLIVFAGLGGIVTSWNAFYVGGSRCIYAMARAHMLPAFLGRLHPKHGTPVNAILLIGALSVLGPFFGRQTMVWLVNAGGLGIVLSYAMVAVTFLVLRKREPDMPRPFRVTHPALVGWGATVLSVGICLLYLPPSPAALTWPYEWAMIGVWSALGAVLYAWARATYGNDAARILDGELRLGRSDVVAADVKEARQPGATAQPAE